MAPRALTAVRAPAPAHAPARPGRRPRERGRALSLSPLSRVADLAPARLRPELLLDLHALLRGMGADEPEPRGPLPAMCAPAPAPPDPSPHFPHALPHRVGVRPPLP